MLPLLGYYVTNIKRDLALDIKTGAYRKAMLETVSQIKPNLERNNVFYFFTDNNGFWEFQSGFGQTLAVWLYNTGKVPNEALTDPDFWDLSHEGLKQYKTGKYGYFMTYSKLLSALKENPDVSSDNVHAYYWDYQKHSVKNVSGNIREKLKRISQMKKIEILLLLIVGLAPLLWYKPGYIGLGHDMGFSLAPVAHF